MRYEDEAIILKYRKFEEKKAIVTLFAKNYGMISGILSNYNQKHNKNILVPGNIVWLNYYSKSKNNLGTINIEIIDPISAHLIYDYKKISTLQTVIILLLTSVLEGQINNNIYNITLNFFHILKERNNFIADYLFFELDILSLLGYGINMHECSVTGKKENTFYVSPRTGLAVSKEIGAPYKEKLYIIPDFLHHKNVNNISKKELIDASKLINFYYTKFFHIELKQFLESREKLITILL